MNIVEAITAVCKVVTEWLRRDERLAPQKAKEKREDAREEFKKDVAAGDSDDVSGAMDDLLHKDD